MATSIMRRIGTTFVLLIELTLIGVFGYFAWTYADKLGLTDLLTPACSRPITYSLGTFDTQFGISKTDFLSDVAKAAAIWQKPINKQLFAYSATNSQVKINLVYDYRQQTTDQLQKIGLTITDDQSGYNKLKTTYDTENASIARSKSALDAMVKTFDAAQASYEAEVQQWNDRGGAPPDVYQQLNQEKVALNAQVAQINATTKTLNDNIDTVNALSTELNKLVSVLNSNVNTYNSTGQDVGTQFEEGVYTSDATGRRIDIYEFDSQQQLVRLLAHELGHALGMQHVTDTNAIMYYLNISKNQVPTATDVAQLKSICGIK